MQPPGWPDRALAPHATAILRAVVAPADAAGLPCAWTRWPGLRATTGSLERGSWADLCAWLNSTRLATVADKCDVPAWSPGRFAGNRRQDTATLALSALVLDCDDLGDWHELLAALDGAGLAYLAHRSPSHRNDGPCKWRLVLPMAAPFDLTPDRAGDRWRDAYTAARLVLGAIGSCWFDPSGANPSRLWFSAAAIVGSPAREVRVHEGRAFDLHSLLAHVAPLVADHAMPAATATAGVATADLVKRVQRYLDKAGPAIQGQGGDVHTFRVAAQLVIDFGLSDGDAMDRLRNWNATCQPPWTEAELRQKVASARRSAKHSHGCAVQEPWQSHAALPVAVARALCPPHPQPQPLFRNLLGVRVVQWLVQAGYQARCARLPPLEPLVVDGGKVGLALAAGGRAKDAGEAWQVVIAASRMEIPLASGGVALLTYTEPSPAWRGQRAVLTLSLNAPLRPGCHRLLPQPSTVAAARRTARWLVPYLAALPRLDAVPYPHQPAAARLYWRLLIELTERGPELAAQGSIGLSERRWLDLAAQAGLPGVLAQPLLESWQDDTHPALPQFLHQPTPGRWTLGPEHEPAVAFIEAGVKRRAALACQHEARAKGLAAGSPRDDGKGTPDPNGKGTPNLRRE